MKVSNLVVVRPRAARQERAELLAGVKAAPPPTPQAVGAFITPQSLVSFPIASGLVTLTWKLFRELFPWGSSTVVPMVTALLIGAVIFLMTVSEEDARPKTLASWMVTVGIGLINSLLLLAAALGISG